MGGVVFLIKRVTKQHNAIQGEQQQRSSLLVPWNTAHFYRKVYVCTHCTLHTTMSRSRFLHWNRFGVGAFTGGKSNSPHMAPARLGGRHACRNPRVLYANTSKQCVSHTMLYALLSYTVPFLRHPHCSCLDWALD